MSTTRGTGAPGAAARAGVAAVVMWVLVVLVGSTMVWAVISRAGREVVGVASPRNAAAAGPRQFSQHVRPATQPLQHHSPSTRGGGQGGPHAAGHDDPDGTESPGDSTKPGGTGQTPSPDDDGPSQTPPSAPSPRRDTSDGRGGSVTAECTGERLSDFNAVPDDGYGAEVERHYSSLKVEFKAQGGGEDVEVEAWCRSGAPHFSRDGGGGGEDEDAHDSREELRARPED